MNKLYIGLNKDIELPGAEFLFINDTVPKFKQARIFDPLKHSFNPFADLDYRKACIIVDIFDALFTRGESTLTKDTGLDFLADALEEDIRGLPDLVTTPDKKSTSGHMWAYSKVRRILRSPVLKKVFCSKPNFHLNPKSVILARISRKELGTFDALALTLFLIASWPGQLVIPSFNRYARPFHTELIEDNRLIAGITTFSQIKDEDLRDQCLLIPDKVGSRCTFTDAQKLAEYDEDLMRRNLVPGTDGYKSFIAEVMA